MAESNMSISPEEARLAEGFASLIGQDRLNNLLAGTIPGQDLPPDAPADAVMEQARRSPFMRNELQFSPKDLTQFVSNQLIAGAPDDVRKEFARRGGGGLNEYNKAAKAFAKVYSDTLLNDPATCTKVRDGVYTSTACARVDQQVRQDLERMVDRGSPHTLPNDWVDRSVQRMRDFQREKFGAESAPHYEGLRRTLGDQGLSSIKGGAGTGKTAPIFDAIRTQVEYSLATGREMPTFVFTGGTNHAETNGWKEFQEFIGSLNKEYGDKLGGKPIQAVGGTVEETTAALKAMPKNGPAPYAVVDEDWAMGLDRGAPLVRELAKFEKGCTVRFAGDERQTRATTAGTLATIVQDVRVAKAGSKAAVDAQDGELLYTNRNKDREVCGWQDALHKGNAASFVRGMQERGDLLFVETSRQADLLFVGQAFADAAKKDNAGKDLILLAHPKERDRLDAMLADPANLRAALGDPTVRGILAKRNGEDLVKELDGVTGGIQDVARASGLKEVRMTHSQKDQGAGMDRGVIHWTEVGDGIGYTDATRIKGAKKQDGLAHGDSGMLIVVPRDRIPGSKALIQQLPQHDFNRNPLDGASRTDAIVAGPASDTEKSVAATLAKLQALQSRDRHMGR